jgi:hypothetical protein
MNVQISPLGSAGFGDIARYEDRALRHKMWANHLIDNESGLVVNNSGTLHYDDHKRMLDDVVAARKYLPTAYRALTAVPGVAASMSLFETLAGYQNMNEFNAKTSMNGSNRESNQTDYQYAWVPQPIYHLDFHIPWRQGGFSYKQGDGVDEATMQVELERDKTLILGNSEIVVNVNGVAAPLYGLTNHPATLTGTISDWTNPANFDGIYSEVVANVGLLFTDRKAGQVPNSILMFAANDVYPVLENDYSSAKGDRTMAERIKAITAIRDIIPSQWLPDGAVLYVEASPQTLRIPTSTDTTVAPWQRTHEMENLKFTVFAASTLQVRADRNNLTGIGYFTKA